MTREQFKELFDQNFDAVRNYVYYRSGDADMATDISQETFLKIWEKQLGDGHKNIRALLFKIAGDLFISQFRRDKKLTAIKLAVSPGIEKQSPEEEMMFSELLHIL